MTHDIDETWVTRMPKAEVHVHLDGCIEKDELVRLATKYDVPLRRPLDQLFEFDGLTDFLHFLDWGASLVRTPDDAASVAYQFAKRQAASGIRYTDVILNPTHWESWRDDVGGLVEALDAGWREAEQDGLPPTGLCLSLLRQQSAAEADELLDLIIDLEHPRIVGLSIDGDEAVAGRVSSRFAETFRRAASRGIRRTVHAGESSGPEGVRDAIDLLQADRIDHGIRAVEDPALVAELADRRIPLGVCPGSNVSLGFAESRETHPIDVLRRAGVRVSLNTDDGTALGSVLHREYLETAHTFGWSRADLIAIARTSIEAAFCSEDQRTALLAELDLVDSGAGS